MRLIHWFAGKQFGKVPTPFRVIYARKPRFFAPILGFMWAEKRLKLEPELAFLIKVLVASRNHCEFCVDIAKALAVQQRIGTQRFTYLLTDDDFAHFSAREQAALRYVRELNDTRTVTDDTFAAARAFFSDDEILELGWLCAVENYYNIQNHALHIGNDHLYSEKK